MVERDEVRLYMDCGEAERTTFHRSPDRLTFSHNSGIFVSNAGSTGLHKFVVSVQKSVKSNLICFMLLIIYKAIYFYICLRIHKLKNVSNINAIFISMARCI